MDPNEALKRIREIIADRSSEDSEEERAAQGDEIVDLFEGLDQWLSRDGFLPDDWKADEDKPWHARKDS